MLPKKRKINRELFNEVFKKGKNYHSSLLFAKVLKIDDKESRFSFVVSKKVVKGAVKRNLLKRRGYAVMREIYPGIKPGFAVAFFFKKKVVGVSYRDLKKDIGFLLEKIGVLRGLL